MADIATLTVRITAALGDFQQSLDKLEASSQKALGALGTASQAANVALGQLAAQGLTRVASKLQDVVADVFEFSDEMVRLADRTGISTEALQELNFVANQTSVPFENLTRAAEMLGSKIAGGSDEMVRVLNAMHLSVSDFAGLKPDEMLKKFLEQVNKFGPAAEKAALLEAAFGKIGPSLIPAVGKIAELTEEVRRLELVISDETIQKIAAFGDQWDRVQLKFQQLVAETLPTLLDRIGDLTEKIKPTVEKTKEWIEVLQSIGLGILKAKLATEEWALALLEFGQKFPGLIQMTGVLDLQIDRLKKQIDEGRKEIERHLSKPDKPLKPTIEVEAEFKLDPKFNKIPDKEKKKAVKLLEDDFSVWMRNRQPFGALFNIYPERIEVDRTLLNHAALGAAVILHQEIIEIVTEHLKKQGFPPIFLPPPEITMAPADMTGIKKDLDDLAEEAAEHAREAFGHQIGDAIGQGLAQAIDGAELPDIGRTIGAGIGGAIGEQVGKVLAEQIGKKLGEGLGTVIGGVIGSAAGPVGAAVGAWLGQTIAAIITEKKHFEQIRREFLLTAGGLENLEKQAGISGVALTALHRAMRAETLPAFTAAMSDYAEAVQAVELAAKKAADALDKVTRTGALLSAADIKGMEIAPTEKTFEFFKAQTEKAAKGLEKFVTNAKISSQAGATAATAAIGAIFADLQLQGATAGEALQALAPSIAALTSQLQTTGFAGTEAFGQLSTMAAYAADSVSGPLFEAIGGLGELMVGLSNTGALTQDMFSGLAGEVTKTWDKLVSMGKGGAAGMALIQKPLQRVWELTKDHGYAVDEATRKLLDEAEAAGIVGDSHRDATDKMIKAVGELVERISGLIKLLTDQMPAGAQAGADKVQDALDGIEAPTITIPIEFEVPEFPDVHAPSESVYSANSTPDIVVNVDGERLARVTARNMSRVLSPYGV